MAITLATLKQHVQHALGGSVASQLDEATIINEAGRHMFMTPWKFRERPPATITTVASQDYIDLPADFGEMIAMNMADGLVRSFTFTTFGDLVQRRATDTGVTNHYWVAISHPPPADEGNTQPAPRMELYPTPTTGEGIITVYRAKWAELTADADNAVVPDYAESALIALVRAFALGYEEEGLEQRLGEVEGGVMYLRLKEKDGLIQPEYGPLRNGALYMSTPSYQIPWDSTSDPS